LLNVQDINMAAARNVDLASRLLAIPDESFELRIKNIIHWEIITFLKTVKHLLHVLDYKYDDGANLWHRNGLL